MLAHDVGLAIRSLKRNPILSALMVAAIACGIATSMIAITMYHARAGNPIPWKSDVLFGVALDTREDDPTFADPRNPDRAPNRLTYRDAVALYESKIPARATYNFRSGHLVSPDRQGVKPFQATSRLTTADFFPMFDVPFEHGSAWTRAADEGPEPVAVISRYFNQKVFGGENSVGRTLTLDGRAFRVIGVIGAWMPQPRYYDLGGAGMDIPEDVYLPFGWTQAMKIMTRGGINCVRRSARVTRSFESVFSEDCIWISYWVELPDARTHERFKEFVNNYATEQRKLGRFPRPKNNNPVLSVEEWLRYYDVIGDESRMQVGLGGMFLLVCILNTLGLMLAKFMSAAPVSGLRRALGATRADIVRQHLVEVVVVGLVGGVVGLLLTLGGLEVMRSLMAESFLFDDHPDRAARLRALTGLDVPMVLVAVGLSMLAGVIAGLYPAWRIGKLSPSTFLKS